MLIGRKVSIQLQSCLSIALRKIQLSVNRSFQKIYNVQNKFQEHIEIKHSFPQKRNFNSSKYVLIDHYLAIYFDNFESLRKFFLNPSVIFFLSV